MKELDYTVYAKKNIEEFEAAVYEDDTFDVYHLMEHGQLAREDVLWYHAFSSFACLCNMPRKNEQIASEIRRYLFREKMGGQEESIQSVDPDSGEQKKRVQYCLPDGSRYDSLTSSELLNRMVKILKECYMSCNLTSDEGIAYKVPQTPATFRKFLLQEVTNRDNLIRIAFALRLKKEKFNSFLTSGSYFRKLSAAVPREMILLYCIENERYEWDFVNGLQREAEKYKSEAETGKGFTVDGKYIYTQNAEAEWAALLQDMDTETFKKDILRPCCYMAVQKSSLHKQYSMRSFQKMYQYSVLKDLEAGMGNCKVYENYDTVFVTETALRYMEQLQLPDDYLPFKKSIGNRVMSANSYCRFLAYRMMMPNTEGKHMVKFYRMKYGRLPDEIRDNVFKVTDLDELRMMEDKPFKAHNINRYDILITKFYFFLMKIWKEGRPFLAESRESAGKLWREFFNMANADLKDTGYPKITSKNPMDVMLRMCFHSLCPLECYNRIYELDILHSLLDDPDGYEAENYPQTGRILNVLEGLEKSYQKISRIDAAKKADYEQVREFCCSVKSSVPVAKK